ncbi:MAG TPA: hypothetical protein H9850_07355 [Candidatus Anaerobiospirillum pullistercoris]|uniref:Uncharacterized protein n=1 Tax=Candidatus Anaerobiospirillum pullistercoris TaxID=2838452 RepID=A0A9D1WDK8_9GAMM|nr:hypothetical protein [Candidatus Anaerobiospirillum pullistercoris]
MTAIKSQANHNREPLAQSDANSAQLTQQNAAKGRGAFASVFVHCKRGLTKPLWVLPVLVIVAALLELFAFNTWAWFDRDAFPRQVVEMPSSQGFAITPSQRVLTIDHLDLPIHNVYLELSSAQPQLVTVHVLFKSPSSKESFAPSTAFHLNVGGEFSARMVHFHAWKERILGLQLVIAPSTNAPLYLSKLVFNEDEPLRFSVLRFVLLCAVLMGGYGLFAQRWYCLRFDRALRAHRWLDHGVMAVAVLWCVLLAVMQLYALQSPNATFLFGAARGINHSAEDSAELVSSLQYLIGVNAVLAVLTTICVISAARTLMTYFSSAKGPNLLLYLLGQLAVAAASMVFYQQMAFVSSEHVSLLCQLGIALVALGAYRSAITADDHAVTQTSWRLWLNLSALAIGLVLVAWSRPWAVLLLLALTAPLWWSVLRTTLYTRLALLRGQVTESDAKKVSVSSALMVVAFCVIALGLGLLLSQVLHVSVDSVIQTTGAGAVAATAGLSVVEHTPLMFEQWWNVSHISNALYYYIFEGLTYFKLFPWVAPNTTSYFSHGEPVVLYERVSLMAMPLCWGLFLCLFPWRRLLQGADFESTKSLLSVVTLGRASVLALLLVSYGTYVSAGVGVYWEAPLLLSGALAAWILVLTLIPVPERAGSLSPVGGALYALACFFLLKTIFIGVVIGFAYSSGLFSGAVLWQLDPDLLLKVGFFFDSFNF